MSELKNTVFILGAGSSASYGYPTGKQLKRMITTKGLDGSSKFALSADYGSEEELNREFKKFTNYLKNECSIIEKNIDDFIAQFLQAGSETIDTFLGKHDEESILVHTGKLLISFFITYHEVRQSLLYLEEDDWISYLLFRNVSYSSNENLIDSLPAFVSFNYDSLIINKISENFEKEHLFQNAHQYVDKNINLVNIYGKISPGLHGMKLNEDLYSYIVNKSQNIHLINTERKDTSDKADSIHSKLESAEKIIILGFGFDRINNNVLFRDKDSLKKLAHKLYICSYNLPKSITDIFDDLEITHNPVRCREFLEKTALPMPLF